MDWVIFGCVIAWLGVVSWFDIQKNEIPHSAWVIIPLIGACVLRAWHGDWAPVLLAILVAAVSERERISQIVRREEIGRRITWLPLLFLGAYLSIHVSPFAALAIIGFWVAWELKWWGGADALAAMTIILIYPELPFVLAFLVVHIIASIGLAVRSLIKDKKFGLNKIPGLPLLFIAVLLFQIVQVSL
jgi:hypothetical protein